MKPSMTATRPALIPAISLLPDALPFLVAEAEAAVPVAVPVAVLVADAVPEEVALAMLSVWPMEGRETSPSTSQPPAVDEGQEGAVRDGV